MPTLPLPSPTTTRAVKENRRPPLTTLATRLIATTRSSNCDLGASSRLSRPRSSRGGRLPCPPGPRRGAGAIELPPCVSLEVQAALAGSLGQRAHAAVVLEAAAVEHHRGDAGRPGPLGQLGADPRGGRQRAPGAVVDELGVDLAVGAEHGQPRPLRRASDPAADAVVAPQAPFALRSCCVHGSIPHLAVLPALRRTTSPA